MAYNEPPIIPQKIYKMHVVSEYVGYNDGIWKQIIIKIVFAKANKYCHYVLGKTSRMSKL